MVVVVQVFIVSYYPHPVCSVLLFINIDFGALVTTACYHCQCIFNHVLLFGLFKYIYLCFCSVLTVVHTDSTPEISLGLFKCSRTCICV